MSRLLEKWGARQECRQKAWPTLHFSCSRARASASLGCFGDLRGIRLDKKEASHRAHLAIAMVGKFRADSRVYEVELDGGHVGINGNPIVDKPIVVRVK